MNESEFQRRADETLLRIEEAIDASGADVDYENAGGVLTLQFTDGSRIIVNRQAPVRQIWVAAKSGGHHFEWDAGQERWLHTGNKRELFEMLEELASAQAGEPLSLH